MIDILKEGIGYLIIEYPDHTRKIIRTSFNKKILEEHNAILDMDSVYDLDRNKYFNINNIDNSMRIRVEKEKPELTKIEEFMESYL